MRRRRRNGRPWYAASRTTALVNRHQTVSAPCGSMKASRRRRSSGSTAHPWPLTRVRSDARANWSPSTDAKRSTVRSRGVSRSIWPATTAPTESGRSATDPRSRATSSSASMNSGLPPAFSAMARSSVSLTGLSRVHASSSASDSFSSRGGSSTATNGDSGTGCRPPGPRDRVTSSTHGRSSSCSAISATIVTDDSSISSASSNRKIVGVVDDVPQEGDHHLHQLRHPEPLVEVAGLGGVRHGHIEHRRQQGEPDQQLGQRSVDQPAQGGHLVVAGGPAVHAGQLAQHPPDRVVGRGAAEVAARAPHHPVVRDLVAELPDERRLAEPGIGHDMDEGTRARGRPGERRPNRGQLALAPGEGGDDLGRLLVHGVAHRLDRDRDDRQHVPLHQERLHLAHVDLHVGAGDHLERGEHLAPRGLPHDPGRDVDRVALHGVRPPVVGAEVAAEHRPAVDTRAQGQPEGPVDDEPRGAEDPVLDVAAATRRAR